MSPLMMRFFTLAGIALASASMQMKARADTPGVTVPQQHQPAATPGPRAH